jgi:hypothetical protein
MLYYVCLVEELGEYSEALMILDVCAKGRIIVDRTAIMEARGQPSYASAHLAASSHPFS